MFQKQPRRLLLAINVVAALGLVPASANPLAPNVVGGSATVQGVGTSSVTITQTTQRTIIDWRTFNIAPNETTRFIQPNSSAVALNRVTGNLGPSTINGTLTANGGVYLINPYGILIGGGAVINTASFLATTSDIRNEDFLAGRNNFTIPGRPDASIVNLGTITASNMGFAALVAPGVRNAGTITANFGRVALASGNTFSLDFYGDRLITLSVNDQVAASVKDVATGQTLGSLVKNEGKLKANGGQVQLSAVAARQVVDSVINNSGVIEARTIGKREGKIVLSAPTSKSKPADAPEQTVVVAGTLDVSSRKAKAGTVEVTGENIQVTGATIKASGWTGGGTVLIGGDVGGGNPNALVASIPQAKLQAGPLPNATTVSVDAATTIDASATSVGDAGKVVVWADGRTNFSGTILAKGGPLAGNGGFVEVSGKLQLAFNGHVDTRAPHGQWGTLLIDPTNLWITTDGLSPEPGASGISAATVVSQLASGDLILATNSAGSQSGNLTVSAPITWATSSTLTLSAHNNTAINAALSGTNGALNIDAGGTITATAAVNVNAFTLRRGSWVQTASVLPTFAAVDFRISPDNGASFLRALSGDGSSASPYQITDVYGLQGINVPDFLTKNFSLANNIDASITATWNTQGGIASGFVPIGNYLGARLFSGTFNGQGFVISNLTVKSDRRAGLFGQIDASGVVSNIGLTNASVTQHLQSGGSGDLIAGGLAGINFGTINRSFTTGTVASLGSNILPGLAGGLIGINYGSISQSYSSATVPNGGGGLVGINSGTISQSFATGDVTATGSFGIAGGLVGQNSFGTISNSYARGTVFGSSDAASLGGLVGSNDNGTISPSYATGSITVASCCVGTGHIGGLVGLNGNGVVINSYWNTDALFIVPGGSSPLVTDGAASSVGIPAAQLRSGLPSGFNSSVWAISASVNSGYPHLRWQTSSQPPTCDTCGMSLRPNLTDIFANQQSNQLKQPFDWQVAESTSALISMPTLLPSAMLTEVTEDDIRAEAKRLLDQLSTQESLSLDNILTYVSTLSGSFDSKYHDNINNQKVFSFRGRQITGSDLNYYFQGVLFATKGWTRPVLLTAIALWKLQQYGQRGPSANANWAALEGYADVIRSKQ